MDPLYGATYLPRKFKIGLAWPGDNCTDIFSHDLGLVPVAGADGADGFAVLVGGGLGASHARPDDTFPRLADPLGWVPADAVEDVAEAVVLAFRDLGNREDRKRARLKYVIEELGLDAFRAEVEQRLGAPSLPRPSCRRGTSTTTWAGTARTTAGGSSACPFRAGGWPASFVPPWPRSSSSTSSTCGSPLDRTCC